MTLNTIVQFLLTTIGPLLDPPEQTLFPDWLNLLRDTNFDSQRLLICLGIDVKYDLIDEKILIPVLSDAIKTYDFINLPNPVDGFDVAAKKVNIVYCSNCHDPDYKTSRYINVMAWGKFHNVVLKQLHESDTTDIDYESYQTTGRAAVEMVAEINGSTVELWGVNRIVWVSPSDEIDHIINNIPADEWATHVVNKYGLPVRSGKQEYLALKYPPGHHVICTQPTSVSADWQWKDGLFLSFKRQDSFGRTFTISSGDTNNGKERIHANLTIEFTDLEPIFLGEFKTLTKDTSQFVNAGINRWN